MEQIVIVVEDDCSVRCALKLSLEAAGYGVIAGSGVETVAATLRLRKRGSPLHLIAAVVDFRLDRGISGISVIRCLEKLCDSAFEEVRRAVADLAIPHALSATGIVTISLGVATTTPSGFDERSDLVSKADKGLYRAKEWGRNRVVLTVPLVTVPDISSSLPI